MKIVACDVPVHHTGKLDRASVLEKGERYFLLGMKKIEETGGTPRAILELAIQAGELGRYDDAIRLWKRYLDGKPAQDVSRAYVNLINACLNADRFDEALDGGPEGRGSRERHEGAPAELRRRGILRRGSPKGNQDDGKDFKKRAGLSPCPEPSCHLLRTGRSCGTEHRAPAAASRDRDSSPVRRSFPSSRSCARWGKKTRRIDC